MILAMVVAMIFAIQGSVVAAESQPEHLVKISTRTFDLGVDVAQVRGVPDFIPMNDIDWLRPILWADSVFGQTTVFHLERTHPSNASAEFLWSFDAHPDNIFTFTHDIPERFQIPGMDVRSESADWDLGFKMVPEDNNADYAVRCFIDRRTYEVGLCVVLAAYPPDPMIYLKARDYATREPWEIRKPKFAKLAVRMREIATCLDVTNEEISFNSAGERTLSGCEAAIGM